MAMSLRTSDKRLILEKLAGKLDEIAEDIAQANAERLKLLLKRREEGRKVRRLRKEAPGSEALQRAEKDLETTKIRTGTAKGYSLSLRQSRAKQQRRADGLEPLEKWVKDEDGQFYRERHPELQALQDKEDFDGYDRKYLILDTRLRRAESKQAKARSAAPAIAAGVGGLSLAGLAARQLAKKSKSGAAGLTKRQKTLGAAGLGAAGLGAGAAYLAKKD